MIHPMLQLACSTCRVTMVEGGKEAAGWSIFFMLIVILAILSGIVICMARIVMHEKKHRDPTLTDGWSPGDSSL